MLTRCRLMEPLFPILCFTIVVVLKDWLWTVVLTIIVPLHTFSRIHLGNRVVYRLHWNPLVLQKRLSFFLLVSLRLCILKARVTEKTGLFWGRNERRVREGQ